MTLSATLLLVAVFFTTAAFCGDTLIWVDHGDGHIDNSEVNGPHHYDAHAYDDNEFVLRKFPRRSPDEDWNALENEADEANFGHHLYPRHGHDEPEFYGHHDPADEHHEFEPHHDFDHLEHEFDGHHGEDRHRLEPHGNFDHREHEFVGHHGEDRLRLEPHNDFGRHGH
jgi:hypothetical protein